MPECQWSGFCEGEVKFGPWNANRPGLLIAPAITGAPLVQKETEHELEELS